MEILHIYADCPAHVKRNLSSWQKIFSVDNDGQRSIITDRNEYDDDVTPARHGPFVFVSVLLWALSAHHNTPPSTPFLGSIYIFRRFFAMDASTKGLTS